MGYELDKLMRQFGVSTPTAPVYGGAAAPSATADKTTSQYQAELARYNDDMAKFKDYQAQYQQRLATGNMYGGAQFNTGLPGAGGVSNTQPLPALQMPKYSTTGAPAITYNQQTGTDSLGNTTTSGDTPYTLTSGTNQLPNSKLLKPGEMSSLNGVQYIVNTYGEWEPYTGTNGSTEIPTINQDTNLPGVNVDTVNRSGVNTGVPFTMDGVNYYYRNADGSLSPYTYTGSQNANWTANTTVNERNNTLPGGQPNTGGSSLQDLYDRNVNQVENTTNVDQTGMNNLVDFTAGNDFGKVSNLQDRPTNYSNGRYRENNTQLYKHGGQVKTHFAVGGINDLASGYGLTDDPMTDFTALPETYEYGPRPKEGPIGSWLEQVAKETVPGVRISGRARTPERNRQVGGVKDSYHLTDNARDLVPPEGMSLGELGNKLKKELGSDFDVIFNTKGHYDHVHVEPGPSLGSNAPAASPAAAPTSELGTLTPPPAEGAPVAPSGRFNELQMLLDQNAGDTMYAEELKAARAKSAEEADAFKTMLEGSLASPEDAKASKAEMYFRLAAAFGSPTKTGAFGENLGLASKEMADYSKGQRESAQGKLATRLKLQEMRMGAAKEDLSTLRALSAEEMKDKRALSQAMIKDYIESGKPQSAAGKQALDEGYKPGTPEYQARVREVAAMDVARETAQIQALVGNLDIAKRREEREEKKGEKLTPQEVTMKRDTEDSLASLDSAMNLIGQAYSLNPNTFDNSLVDQGRRKVLEAAGAKDPKLINTRNLENLLKSQMITSAAEKMKGVLSDSDIKLLLDIQGLDAKSVEERANILRTAYTVLKRGRARLQQRLKDVSSGAYREVSGD